MNLRKGDLVKVRDTFNTHLGQTIGMIMDEGQCPQPAQGDTVTILQVDGKVVKRMRLEIEPLGMAV